MEQNFSSKNVHERKNPEYILGVPHAEDKLGDVPRSFFSFSLYEITKKVHK